MTEGAGIDQATVIDPTQRAARSDGRSPAAIRVSTFSDDFDGLTVASTHGSPWRYDSHVPLIFAGAGIPSQRLVRSVQTVDVAPTSSILIGAKPPSGSVGAPLSEVMPQK